MVIFTSDARALNYLLLVLLLAGCGSQRTAVIESSSSAYKSSTITVIPDANQRGVLIDDKLKNEFETTLKRQLLRKGFANGNGLTLRYWFTEADAGSRTARTFSLGLGGGSGKVQVLVEFYDARGNKLAQTDTLGQVKGGFLGGSFAQALNNAADSIAEHAKRTYYSKDAAVTLAQHVRVNPGPSKPYTSTQPLSVAPIPSSVAPNGVAQSGLKTWQIAINTNPQGAIIKAYDQQQNLYQIGTSPTNFLWPLQTQADSLVILWQGRQMVVLPTFMESISVDFSQQPPVVKGGTVIGVHQK